MASALPGTTIGHGRYEIVELLGGGSMATVHRARDTVLGVERAVKLLHRNLAEVPAIRSRFLQEAKVLARLEHPNVLRLYDVGEDDGTPFLVTELVREGNLQQAMALGPVETGRALDAAFQVLQALAVAHRHGVVHRDVKPANVLVAGDTFRLADFGIALVEIDAEHRTRTGTALGSSGYMAPEQRADAHRARPAADLYAVGALLYALLTARTPPNAFLADDPPPELARVPDAVRPIVLRAMAQRPEDRYRDAREMAAAIAKAAGRNDWQARFDRLVEDDARRALGVSLPNAPSGTTAMTVGDEGPTPGGYRWLAIALALVGIGLMVALIAVVAIVVGLG